MANLEYIKTQKKTSKLNKRFFTALDMSIVKKDIAARNGLIKRGEVDRSKVAFDYIVRCGCGVEGCFIHGQMNKNPYLYK